MTMRWPSMKTPSVVVTPARRPARRTAWAISSVTLVTSALGGWVAGALSDRYGRVRVLQLTIVWFSLFTFLGAFARVAKECPLRSVYQIVVP